MMNIRITPVTPITLICCCITPIPEGWPYYQPLGDFTCSFCKGNVSRSFDEDRLKALVSE